MREKAPKVLCIQPPVYDFALYDLFFKPYGLARIAAWLEKGGYRVEFLNGLDYREPRTLAALGAPRRKADGTGKFPRHEAALPPGVIRIRRKFSRYGLLPEVLEERINEAEPDLVLVASQMTYWYQGVREAVAAVKRAHPSVPVIVGGVYATLMPEHCRSTSAADYVVRGEGFDPLREILTHEGFSVPGDAPTEGELLLRPELWGEAGVIRLNRGCPYRCSYCASRLIEPDFTGGDPDLALERLLEMHRRLGIRDFAFYDDALLVNKERLLLPLLEKLLRKKLPLRFYTPNAVHMRFIDGETASLMARAGFQELRLGYESSDGAFHQELDQKYRPQEVPPAISAVKRAGFDANRIILYVLAGLPGQRAAEVEETLEEASELGVRLSVAEYSPVPGTALWPAAVRMAAYPIDEEPLYHNNSFFPMEWEGFTREELERLKRLSHALSP